MNNFWQNAVGWLVVGTLVSVLLGVVLLRITRLRDRGGYVRLVADRFLGAFIMLVGLVLAAYLIYSLSHPTREFGTRGPTPFHFLFPLALTIAGWIWLTNKGPGIEETPPDFDCEELRASVEKAKANIHWFLDQVDRNVDGAFVKFPIETPNGLLEHIWAYVHSFRDGAFNVSLANDPFDEDQESSGRRDVPLEEVEDWQIMYPDGRIKGAYSLIALFENYESSGKRLTPKMRKQKAQLIDAQPGEEA